MNRRHFRIASIVVVFAALTAQIDAAKADTVSELTKRDLQFLSGFTLAALPALPDVASNHYADDLNAAQLGHKLFFDPGLSANGKVSCASCHSPQRHFTDGLVRGQGIGQTDRNTPSILGTAYGPWKFWDGRKDSLWAQALAPIEHPEEHGLTREQVYQRIITHYRDDYAAVFGNVNVTGPDRETQVLVNIGKALEAYQRRLTALPSRFDDYIKALSAGRKASPAVAFSPSEIGGMRLFMGRAACASCHNGPLFTNFEFHNTGAPEPDPLNVDLGRYDGIEQLRTDEFNCLSKWSDANPQQCDELLYLKTLGPELVGAFKTPSLRNVANTAPYMREGQFASLEEVVAHYNKPSPPFYDRDQHPHRPHFDVLPLGLSEQELQDLVAFLKTLTSPVPTNDPWWQPPR